MGFFSHLLFIFLFSSTFSSQRVFYIVEMQFWFWNAENRQRLTEQQAQQSLQHMLELLYVVQVQLLQQLCHSLLKRQLCFTAKEAILQLFG